MIYTVTFNPALDYTLTLPCVLQGEINRSLSEETFAGGKGINVSFVLGELGVSSTALGFIAGFTGDEIERQLHEKGIKTDFVRLKKGNSRINVKLRADFETDINCQGPEIAEDELNAFYDKLKNLTDGDVLILAGSIPKMLPFDTYEKVLKAVADKQITTIVDAEGELLLNTLKYRPFLIKPNHLELAAILGKPLNSEEDIINGAKALLEKGARNVMVSMAEKGAILVAENGKIYKAAAPKGRLINSVGAGDSSVAGFVAGYLKSNDFEHALKLGVASGSATAFSLGLATKDKIYEIIK